MLSNELHTVSLALFLNGPTSWTTVTGEEMVGHVFITYVLVATGQGKEALQCSPALANNCISMYSEVLEKLLCRISWMTAVKVFKFSQSMNTMDAEDSNQYKAMVLPNLIWLELQASNAIKQLIYFISRNFVTSGSQH